MVSEAVALNKKFIGVCGIISKMKVVEDPTSKRMPYVKYQYSNSNRVMEINDMTVEQLMRNSAKLTRLNNCNLEI